MEYTNRGAHGVKGDTGFSVDDVEFKSSAMMSGWQSPGWHCLSLSKSWFDFLNRSLRHLGTEISVYLPPGKPDGIPGDPRVHRGRP